MEKKAKRFTAANAVYTYLMDHENYVQNRLQSIRHLIGDVKNDFINIQKDIYYNRYNENNKQLSKIEQMAKADSGEWGQSNRMIMQAKYYTDLNLLDVISALFNMEKEMTGLTPHINGGRIYDPSNQATDV